MKYLLFDTNIYLDMAVNRRNNVNVNLIRTFSALLSYGQVSIILPEIIKYETFKNLEDEVKKVGQLINEPIKNIENIYWLTGLHGKSIDVEQYKKEAKKPLQDILDIFITNQQQYIKQLQKSIETIFNDSSTICISEDSKLLNSVLKRKIYKRAPFHNEVKESYADAMITEILINIKNYIKLTRDDTIYFVTGNYRDFSINKNNKNIFHPHIAEDLKEVDIFEQVKFINHFSQLVLKELEEEITNAKLEEQFEAEMQEENYLYFEDNLRESAGLSPLSSFQDMMEEHVGDCNDASIIIDIFSDMNDIYSDFQEIYNVYDDEVLTWLEGLENHKIIVVNAFNTFFNKFGANYLVKNIDDIISWVNAQKDLVLFEEIKLPDYIDINEKVLVIDANHKEILLTWENINLYPESGEQQVAFCLLKENSQTIARGSIEVTYGYIDEDEDGNIGNGCAEDIEINFNQIVNELGKILSVLKELKFLHEKYTDFIQDSILSLPF
jgi:hypothetical protein